MASPGRRGKCEVRPDPKPFAPRHPAQSSEKKGVAPGGRWALSDPAWFGRLLGGLAAAELW
jgi:hypothetical protein